MKRAALIVAIGLLALAVLSRTEIGNTLFGWGPDHGNYFRLKVKVAYNGAPQDFDIVVACNVNLSRNEGGSSPTYEVGLIPTLFGRRMSDGAALVVRPPEACRGETTANGKVPAEFVPLMIVYDDADTLAFGTAYLTEDAYHNPLSVLTFGGATIETATDAEFEAFHASQNNVVTRAMYYYHLQPEQRGSPTPPAVFAGTDCYAFARFKLIGDELSAAKRLWPADHPQYWEPTLDERNAIDPIIPYNRLMQSDHEPAAGHERLQFSFDGQAARYGIATTSGNGRMVNHSYPASVYPDIGGWIRLPWPTDPAGAAKTIQRGGPRVGSSVDYRDGQTRGFAYCWTSPEFYPPGTWIPGKETALAKHYYSLPGVNFVDGEAVQTREWHGPPAVIVERDEYLFYRFPTSLSSTRGDI